jgi:hypothetical protein
VITLLVDHNIEGHADLLWSALDAEGWVNLVPLCQVRFAEAGLPPDATDRAIWHCAQERQMLLLTANRNMDDKDSLEQTIRDANQFTSLPVITIADVDRLAESAYRHRCAERLMEIVLYLDNYLGTGRLYIP